MVNPSYPNYRNFSGIYMVSEVDFMDGHLFESFCAYILSRNGFVDVVVTQGSGDQGVDILASKNDIRYAVQCKNYEAALSNKSIQEVYAGKTHYNCHVGVVMTNSTFTPGAIELATSTGVLLWDRNELQRMIDQGHMGQPVIPVTPLVSQKTYVQKFSSEQINSNHYRTQTLRNQEVVDQPVNVSFQPMYDELPSSDTFYGNNVTSFTAAPNVEQKPSRMRKGMKFWAIFCFVLSSIYFLIAIFEGMSIFSAVVFFGIFALMFLLLAFTPKKSKYLFGRQKGIGKTGFVLVCIYLAFISVIILSYLFPSQYLSEQSDDVAYKIEYRKV